MEEQRDADNQCGKREGDAREGLMFETFEESRSRREEFLASHHSVSRQTVEARQKARLPD
jgi:hypothetical protein